MAIESYPFEGQDTTEDQYTRLFRELQDSGIAASYGSPDLAVSAGTGMQVTIQPGLALVRAAAFRSSAVEVLAIDASSASLRTDLVVLRLDPAANAVTLQVVKGTPGAGEPALTQTDTGVYEIPLAAIAISAGASSITNGMVLDRRKFVSTRVGAWSTATRPSNPRKGQLGYNVDTQGFEFWDGAWGLFSINSTTAAWVTVPEPADRNWITAGAGGPLRYCKDALGFVHIQGYINPQTNSSTSLFTLPVGYRISATMNIAFPVGQAGGTGSSGQNVTLFPNGTVNRSFGWTVGSPYFINVSYFPAA